MESKIETYLTFSKNNLDHKKDFSYKHSELIDGYILSDSINVYKINDIDSTTLDFTQEKLNTELVDVNFNIQKLSYQLMSDLNESQETLQNQLNKFYDDKKNILEKIKVIEDRRVNLTIDYYNEINTAKDVIDMTKTQGYNYELILNKLNDIHQNEKNIEICKFIDKYVFLNDEQSYYTQTTQNLLKEQKPEIKIVKNDAIKPQTIKLTKKIVIPQVSKEQLTVSLVEPTIPSKEPKEPLNDIFNKCDVSTLNTFTEDNIIAQLSNADKLLYKEYNKLYKYSPRVNTDGHQYTETEYAMKCLKSHLKTIKGDTGLVIKLKKKPIIPK